MRGAQMRCLAVLLAVLVSGSSVAVADCPTELKPTDSYKELSAILKCLNDEIATLRADRGRADRARGDETAAPGPAGPAAKAPAAHMVDDVSVQLVGCMRANAVFETVMNLHCTLVVIPRTDGTFQVDTETYVVTDLGDRKKIVEFFGRNATKPGYWNLEQYKGVRLEHGITFGPISIQVAKLARLELIVAAGGSWKSLLFTDVPVHRGFMPEGRAVGR